jgi:flagellum-specific peptidoglycan hydrolase FlgJ
MRNHVVSLKHDIDEEALSEILNELAVLFVNNIVANLDAPQHVINFYSRTDFIYEALLQQYKYNIPASVILANATDESSYGQSPLAKYSNNYFGIKAKKGYVGKTCHIETPEELTEKEYKAIKGTSSFVRLKTTKYVSGNKIYVVYIKDTFRKYGTYRESFNDFSKFLTTQERYATIFQKGGASWTEWCAMFRPKRDGGIPYATSTSKSKRLKSIIVSYRLYLLDFSGA